MCNKQLHIINGKDPCIARLYEPIKKINLISSVPPTSKINREKVCVDNYMKKPLTI